MGEDFVYWRCRGWRAMLCDGVRGKARREAWVGELEGDGNAMRGETWRSRAREITYGWR